MQGEVLISMIVPVYNAGIYLKECLDSIVGNYLELLEVFPVQAEIILVDDGSTDGSGKTCDLYREQYPFLQVLHQANHGSSNARNRGVRQARGRYLLFVDSDDYIAAHSMRKIADAVRHTAKDWYFLKSFKLYPDGTTAAADIWAVPEKGMDKQEWMDWFSRLKKYPGSACDKVIRRELITHNQIYFEEGVFAEDLFWVLQGICYAESYQALDFDYYFYRQNVEGSNTGNITCKKTADLLHAVENGVQFAQSGTIQAYQPQIYCMMAYELEIALLLYGYLHKTSSETKKIRERLEKQLWLFDYRSQKRTKVIRRMVKIIGVDGCAKVLRFVRERGII